MAEKEKPFQIRCHVCGCVTEADRGKVAQHQEKNGKRMCYGSFSPVLTGSRGEILPGELIFKGRFRNE